MYQKSANWLRNKCGYSDLESLSLLLGLDENVIEGLLNGEICPTAMDIVCFIRGFKLDSEQTLELLSVVAEELNMSPNSMYDYVVEAIVIMAENKMEKSF